MGKQVNYETSEIQVMVLKLLIPFRSMCLNRHLADTQTNENGNTGEKKKTQRDRETDYRARAGCMCMCVFVSMTLQVINGV